MEENVNNQPMAIREEESSIQLRDIWEMFWSYKWWYVGTVLVCLCLALLYLYRTPSTYNRTAKVIIDESEQDAMTRSLSMASGMMRMRYNNSVYNE
ncbi:MAG: Wzz/FepE/Etk N-terminal domain-containing protein, partial [Candidatus Cryptobacteroides sp.]